jgi:hypothetical protein
MGSEFGWYFHTGETLSSVQYSAVLSHRETAARLRTKAQLWERRYSLYQLFDQGMFEHQPDRLQVLRYRDGRCFALH